MRAALQKCIINESNIFKPADGFPLKRWKEIEIINDTNMEELKMLYNLKKPESDLEVGYRIVNLDNLDILWSGGEVQI